MYTLNLLGCKWSKDETWRYFTHVRDKVSVEEGVLLLGQTDCGSNQAEKVFVTWAAFTTWESQSESVLPGRIFDGHPWKKIEDHAPPRTERYLFKIGETIYASDYRNSKKSLWVPARIVKKTDAVLYECVSEDLGVIKRKSHQLLKYPFDGYGGELRKLDGWVEQRGAGRTTTITGRIVRNKVQSNNSATTSLGRRVVVACCGVLSLERQLAFRCYVQHDDSICSVQSLVLRNEPNNHEVALDEN